MKNAASNQRILCAYALLFTVAGGIVLLDPVQRSARTRLPDAPLPEAAAAHPAGPAAPPLSLAGTLASQQRAAPAAAPR